MATNCTQSNSIHSSPECSLTVASRFLSWSDSHSSMDDALIALCPSSVFEIEDIFDSSTNTNPFALSTIPIKLWTLSLSYKTNTCVCH